ncbi:MAG: thiosulfate oxidation carrier protein SoxY, partial [Gammaproteobacteria bacterium]|nr:thiosulfate oxidation carrier protein SoxY [Gammaproteobacteria bacterium]
MKRRSFLKGTLATGVLSVAVGAGMLKPREVMAAWPEDAFSKKSLGEAMSAMGAGSASESGDIKIKAPDIAENGAVVPISVSTSISGVEKISVFVEQNPQPLAASFDLTSSCDGFISTRIKMGKTSDVVAVV